MRPEDLPVPNIWIFYEKLIVQTFEAITKPSWFRPFGPPVDGVDRWKGEGRKSRDSGF
jgi:hypothetical protein